VGLIAKELLRHAIRLELVGRSGHEDRNRARKGDVAGANEETPSQQLEQAKLAIAELYQENRELRRQLATKTVEASAAQSHQGNVAWLKRQLREAQDVIVQLREAQRLAKERHEEHPRECEAAGREVCVAPTNAQKEKA
jgi:hypothetical protein